MTELEGRSAEMMNARGTELWTKAVLEIEVQPEGGQDLHFEAVKMRGILTRGLHEKAVICAEPPQVTRRSSVRLLRKSGKSSI